MIRVLIVDDEPFIRQGLKILIDWEAYGFQIVDEAACGKDAIEFIKNNKYDLVITDIKMPNINGMEMIEYLRKYGYDKLKIIVLSGYYEFSYAKQAIKYNVTDYILKPIQKEELVRVLQEFKDEYEKEIEKTQTRVHTEKAALERNLNAICSGVCEPKNLEYVSSKLPFNGHLRYISIEMNMNDEQFNILTNKEKSDAIGKLLLVVNEFLGEYKDCAFIDIDKRNEVYGVSFIYAKEMSQKRNLREQEYILNLQEYIKEQVVYAFNFYIGQMVESLQELNLSCKSAVIARSFQNYRCDKEIAYYDEMATVKSNAYGIKKEELDELVQYTEENNIDKIDECIDRIYLELEKNNVDPSFIRISIDYLLCQYIYIARELDPEVDRTEIFQYINQCVFEGTLARGSKKHFGKFVKEFADYLMQLRQNNSNDILKKVEKEIESHYMENLSLKSLSEKYYINSAYLGQIFKKKYSMSFKDYLNNYRIDRASELLTRTNDKVCNIAQLAGYNSLDYFISKFVAAKGKTPLQYRKQFLEIGG